jgi:hypothetical protein
MCPITDRYEAVAPLYRMYVNMTSSLVSGNATVRYHVRCWPVQASMFPGRLKCQLRWQRCPPLSLHDLCHCCMTRPMQSPCACVPVCACIGGSVCGHVWAAELGKRVLPWQWVLSRVLWCGLPGLRSAGVLPSRGRVQGLPKDSLHRHCRSRADPGYGAELSCVQTLADPICTGQVCELYPRLRACCLYALTRDP